MDKVEKLSRSDRSKNVVVLRRVKDERNILYTINRREANWLGRILCGKFLLKHVIEGEIEGRVRQTRRHKQLLNDHKKTGR
jgi:hypothetical protein